MNLPPFHALLSAYQDDLYRFLLGTVGRGEVDDCFQEVVLAALRGYPRLRNDRNLKGWLFSIGYRKAMDVHRDQKRRAEVRDTDFEASDDAWLLTDKGLWEAVKKLSEGQCVAVLLRFWGDLNYEEIASILNISNAAARKRVSDGIARLKKVIS